MKNFGCLTILVLVLAAILALLVPMLNSGVAQAGFPTRTPQPPPQPTVVPTQPPSAPPVVVPPDDDRDCKKGCSDEPPNSSENPLPEDRTEPDSASVTTAPGLVTGLKWGCGGGARVHIMN